MIETIPALTETMSAVSSAQGGFSDPAELLYPEDTWIGQLRLWVDGLPAALQWLGLILISAIPFIESYGGGFIGVIAGMPVWAAIVSAVIGNALSVAMLVYGAHWIRTQVLKRRQPKELVTASSNAARRPSGSSTSSGSPASRCWVRWHCPASSPHR